MNSSVLGCRITSSFKDGGSTSHPLVVVLQDPPQVIAGGGLEEDNGFTTSFVRDSNTLWQTHCIGYD